MRWENEMIKEREKNPKNLNHSWWMYYCSENTLPPHLPMGGIIIVVEFDHVTCFSQWNANRYNTKALNVLAWFGFFSCISAIATCPRKPLLLQLGSSKNIPGIYPQYGIMKRSSKAIANQECEIHFLLL